MRPDDHFPEDVLAQIDSLLNIQEPEISEESVKRVSKTMGEQLNLPSDVSQGRVLGRTGRVLGQEDEVEVVA